MEGKMKKSVFRLIEILTVPAALIAVSVTAPSGAAHAATEQPPFTAADVQKVYDSMQSMKTALADSLAKKPQRPRTAFSRLVSDGFLTSFPSVPEGIGDGSNSFGKGDYGAWSDRNARIGGCGPNNIGENQTYNILLRNVSTEFCKAYNQSQGLAPAILGNCAQNPDSACAASGSLSGNDPVDAGKSSFCFKAADSTNIILFNTGVDSKVPCSN